MKAYYSAGVIKTNNLSIVHIIAQTNRSMLLQNIGKKWHDRRKVITPAFHFNILERFVEIFDRLGNSVVDKLNKFDSTDDVEFYPIAVLYALDVMCGK